MIDSIKIFVVRNLSLMRKHAYLFLGGTILELLWFQCPHREHFFTLVHYERLFIWE